MTQQHDDKISECKSIFVSWVWLVGILVGLFAAGVGGTVAYVRAEMKQDQMIEKQNEKIDARISAVERVIFNQDTIKGMLRSLVKTNERR